MSNRKNLFFCISLIAASVCLVGVPAITSAKGIGELDNKAGGKIVITDEQGPCSAEMHMLYSYAADGKVTLGCWQLRDYRVMVHYENDTIYSYSIYDFSIPKERQGAAKPKATTGKSM